MTLESSQPNIKLSIVIASAAGGGFLARCLDSLRDQVDPKHVEVIVVDRCGGEVPNRIESKFPFVRLIQAESKEQRLSVPELRAQGVRIARGNIIAVIEEHCVAPSNWVETICSSMQVNDVAMGGPILDDDYARLVDWVVYFSEYHNFLPPWTEDKHTALNGANVAYSGKTLLSHLERLNQGYWEVVLHPLLEREGRVRAIPQMGVRHIGPFNYGYYLKQRYLLSRVWGGTQRQHATSIRRLLYLVLAPLLPVLLLARIARRVSHSPRYIRKFIRCFPLLVPVSVVYVWGEWLGYLVGVGDALERVE